MNIFDGGSRPGESPPLLSHDAVHLWLVPLDVLTKLAPTLLSTLSADEQDRAQRFHFQRDRDRFTAARSTLRGLLGQYLGRPPASLHFDYGSAGKPSLQRSAAEPDIRFNLSHSAEYALLAIALGRDVGVDIEHRRPEIDLKMLAEHHFSPREFADLQRCTTGEQTVAFYRIWSRKEACIKAIGLGLQIPLDSFDVPLTAIERSVTLQVSGQTLSLYSAHELPGFSTALAVCGTAEVTVQLLKFEP
jgi:4'-phosphopantetheinyl transferase